MKKVFSILTAVLLFSLLSGCTPRQQPAQIAATTLPVYEFTSRLCEGTGLTVTQLVSESVSCLHDYSLSVDQVRRTEAAELVVISGAGLEEFMEDLLQDKQVIDSSAGIPLIEGGHEHSHDHEDEAHEEESHEGHHHEQDPHIWLSPVNAKLMAQNICSGLTARYPDQAATIEKNLQNLLADLDALDTYGREQLADVNCRELITFHD